MNVLIIVDILYWRELIKITSVNINIDSYVYKYKLYNDMKPKIIKSTSSTFDDLLKREIEKNKKVR